MGPPRYVCWFINHDITPSNYRLVRYIYHPVSTAWRVFVGGNNTRETQSAPWGQLCVDADLTVARTQIFGWWSIPDRLHVWLSSCELCTGLMTSSGMNQYTLRMITIYRCGIFLIIIYYNTKIPVYRCYQNIIIIGRYVGILVFDVVSLVENWVGTLHICPEPWCSRCALNIPVVAGKDSPKRPALKHFVTQLDDGNIYRKAPLFDGKSYGFL